MDYLFTPEDTFLVLSFLVYAGFAFFQLQKMLILNNLGYAISPLKSMWLVARVLLALPVMWTIKFII